MEQWFSVLLNTQQLIDDLETVEWPEKVKLMQQNWIGRSEGAEFGLAIADIEGEKSKIYHHCMFTQLVLIQLLE